MNAPLGSVRIHSAHITEHHSAVSLLVDESPELRAWLWSTDRIHRGKALGARFRLTVDGVSIEAQRIFAASLVRVKADKRQAHLLDKPAEKRITVNWVQP